MSVLTRKMSVLKNYPHRKMSLYKAVSLIQQELQNFK